jgi:hypothetical protein
MTDSDPIPTEREACGMSKEAPPVHEDRLNMIVSLDGWNYDGMQAMPPLKEMAHRLLSLEPEVVRLREEAT